jgi:hypothetical protein
MSKCKHLDCCGYCRTEIIIRDSRITALQHDHDRLQTRCTALVNEKEAIREAAQAVVDSRRGMGHLIPSSVGWVIDELGQELENANERL